MKIGFFTDTYFPQVSGVATSIKTLKDELEKHGHEVYIFTTTDPNATDFEEDVIRMPSVPFVSFKDRRVVVRGMWYAYLIAKELELDLIHTHTEFGAGILGKMVGKKMKIPVIHTYHTMYEDYLHYIAKGKVVRPSHVKFFSRVFTNHTTGVVCPSERVIEKLRDYGVTAPMRIIPTGIEIDKFLRPDITEEMIAGMRQQLGIEEQQIMLLSLSRISYEKNIQAIIQGLPQIIEKLPQTRLVIVGNGPYLEDLKELAEELEVSEYVQFTGEVPNEEVAIYYKAADYFVSASTSETQGLTYTEAMAAGVQCVAEGNAYLNNLFDHESLGKTFKTDSDFAPTLIDYIQANIKMDQTILDEKLFEISSTNFGNKMIEFYQDTLIYFDQLQMEKENADSIKKIKVKFTSFRK
ncbi:cell wall glycolipid biosynthesis glucosyltransferase BgsB [Enterococcus faecalis]|uniref:cell wall glycolipid biosynthesis glucosyltransferase BgsB n=1 Tax=Enterococcus TaxID=1350 RepID=UPI000403AF04|nr:cell wall glycolipid biosynthesis glucosyltransferase BgsB [Enterococcus faecalis]EGO8714225.1 glycosyltransferase family 4 protein [Enterococcus faecalis]EGO8757072.1 glycosyltransferase family 4 protein [Enterococcus faecalis]EGO8833604.1 glycosyltransferase family 4 protein [Enterococcus faecalis]EGO8856717.1 glycosyltransferase family 4 protein [Enterococcus faecalis]EGO9019447.1 glycosyltransferase family 4 protein [Enterococcus faecalis]